MQIALQSMLGIMLLRRGISWGRTLTSTCVCIRDASLHACVRITIYQEPNASEARAGSVQQQRNICSSIVYLWHMRACRAVVTPPAAVAMPSRCSKKPSRSSKASTVNGCVPRGPCPIRRPPLVPSAKCCPSSSTLRLYTWLAARLSAVRICESSQMHMAMYTVMWSYTQ